jgi:Septum formation
MDVAPLIRQRRTWLAVAVAFAVASFALSGCSSGEDTPAPRTPVAGACWAVTYDQYQDLSGGDLASCSGGAHQAISYAVVPLTQSFSNGGVDSKGNPTAAVLDAATTACKQQQDSIFPGLSNTGLLLPNLYFPSTTDWHDGAHWVQCVIAQIKYGSTVASPALADLPSTVAMIQSELKASPKKFDLCEDDPQLNGPDGAGATYADCTGAADWSMIASLTMKGAVGAPYPGDKPLQATAAKQCATINAPKGHEVFAEPPTAQSWEQGDRELDCWLNNN